jgi:asparagine N-glycosylation enzyme membrane subunit Stt3
VIVLFSCSLLVGIIVAQPPGTFERVTVTNLLTAWVVYLIAGILLSRSLKECLRWGGLAACTYALLGLSWSGWLYLAPAMLGTAVLLILLDWN